MMSKSFETLIVGAQIGFLQGCTNLTALDADQARMSKALDDAKKLYKSGLDPSFHSNIVDENATDPSTYVSILRTLIHIMRSRQQCSPKPTAAEVAAVLDSCTVLSRACITEIVGTLESLDIQIAAEGTRDGIEGIPGDTEMGQKGLGSNTQHIGQLLDFKWRCGVALCSSSCKDLQAPYVAISFSVRDCNGKVNHHTAELSYAEFQDFSSQFRQVKRIMEEL